ncbi:MAG TPA: hypothetical protein VJA26_18175 [Gammaproteobacteria bacterium]|nr:hypothetical protein [Gammaproteobacteria bacterium]
MRVLWWLGVILCCAAMALPARAEVTATDLQIAGRALSFMENPLTGVVRVGILYAPSSPRSQRQAEELESLLGGGLKAGNVELRPEMVKMSDAGDSNVDLFFLTEYVNADEARAADLGAARQRACITTDIAQVESGACLMGVRSRPKVEIVINQAAAKDSGVVFATVFRVMITEI